jgi:uncharacterized protein
MQASAANGAQMRRLSETGVVNNMHGRYHFQHGPIDVVAELFGDATSVRLASQLLWQRFVGVLEELVSELPLLKSAIPDDPKARNLPTGLVAARMFFACAPFSNHFITPMAAVAGSVADELLQAIAGCGLRKALINNGGDIAIYVAPAEKAVIKVLAPAAEISICAPSDSSVSVGVATSGWSGRSFSLGLADAVTVVAQSAAIADAAATMIANAVGPQLVHPAIVRRSAVSLKDDSDLGSRLVTFKVDPLPKVLAKAALEQGRSYAATLVSKGTIFSASLALQAESVIVSSIAPNCLFSTTQIQPSIRIQNAA